MVIVSEQNNRKKLRNFGVKSHLFVVFLQLGDIIIVVSVAASCDCRDYVKWWLLFYILPGQGAFLQLCRSSGCDCVRGLQCCRSLSIDTNKIFVLTSDLVGFYFTSPPVEHLGR